MLFNMFNSSQSRSDNIDNVVLCSRIEKVIASYLNMETNYALLINGERGSGKTFFVQNTVLNLVKNTRTRHNNSKNYKPIYISLYGLKSVDDVYGQLALELIPFLKNKNLRLTANLAKIMIRGALNFRRLGSVDDYIKDISKTAKHVVDTKDFVIFFDDLDRISKTLDLNEFIGFVNSLVEHNNNKIVIVADENNVADSDNYKAVREKTIGTVIEFTISFEDLLSDIITKKYKPTFASYYSFLLDVKHDILSLFETAKTKNLRTLIYFLQHFESIFYSLYNYLGLDKDSITSLNLKKLNEVMRFTAAISIEFKRHKVKYNVANGIDDVHAINKLLQDEWIREEFGFNQKRNEFVNTNGNNENEIAKAYKEYFIDTFYKKIDYRFFVSIFNYVTGGNELDINLIKSELEQIVDNASNQQTLQDAVYAELCFPQVYDLDTGEYKRLSEQLLDFAVAGLYPLEKYTSIFYFLIRFPDLLGYSYEFIADKLIKSLQDNSEFYTYDSHLEHYFDVDKDAPHYELSKKIFQTAVVINESRRLEREKLRDVDLFQKLKDDADEFYNLLVTDYSYKSVFNNWNTDEFFEYIAQVKPSNLRFFLTSLKKRYSNLEEHHVVEYDFLETILNFFKKQNAEQEISPRSYVIKNFVEVLQSIVDRLKIFRTEKLF